MRQLTRRILAVGLGAAAAGVAGCSGHKPAPAPQATATARAPVAAATPTGPVIVTLVSRTRTLVVTKGPAGPLYCLKDANGNVLVPPSTLEEVAVRNPELHEEIEKTMAMAVDASAARR